MSLIDIVNYLRLRRIFKWRSLFIFCKLKYRLKKTLDAGFVEDAKDDVDGN